MYALKKWKKNLIELSVRGRVGKCPYCKSEDTSYKVTLLDKKDNIGYVDIWCNNCKKAYHISRAEVQKDDGKEIPKGLIYT